MNEQVLTNEEKDALLEGVASGEVEVTSSNGPRYASVVPFDVAPRNRIVTNSFPRLRNIDRKLAGLIARAASTLLNDKVEAEAGLLTTPTWGRFSELEPKPALLFEFTAAPLDGSAVIRVESEVVQQLVEAFYGGSAENPPRHDIEGFTPGEISVVTLLCNEVLKGIEDVWRDLISLDTEKVRVVSSTDIAEIIESAADVIATEFVLHQNGEQHSIQLVWPRTMLASLLPALEGAKRDRDAELDSHWQQVIRERVPRAYVDVSSRIGHASMSLREVASLQAGDIIEIDDPHKGIVYAKHVPVLEGRFGVVDGRYAIETTRWLADTAAFAGDEIKN